MNKLKVKTALISVYDKKGIVEFSRRLDRMGVKILSTGGTATELSRNKIKVVSVSEYTGFPEIMDGRVKTLNPKIHGGLLAERNDKKQMKDAKDNEISMIDMLVVNLYPFEETIKKKVPVRKVLEMIDIGGPSMLRSAAKNFNDVIVVTDSDDYSFVLSELSSKGDISSEKRKELAVKAFQITSAYDAAINHYFSKEAFPKKIVLAYTKQQNMRYGENPYQDAAFYVSDELNEPCVSSSVQIQGKQLSYNNIMDADAGIEILKEFRDPCVAVIKHANPSGVAVGNRIEDALEKAYNADTLSAFGCIITMNRIFTGVCAEFVKDKFIEVIIAEDFDKEAMSILSEKKNLRLLKVEKISSYHGRKHGHESSTIKKVIGGMLVQTRSFPDYSIEGVEIHHKQNAGKDEIDKLTEEARKGTLRHVLCVTKKMPTKEQMADMIFAMKVCKHVKSNSVLYAKDLVTVGIGAGQTSRVDSAIIATRKSVGKSKGAVMASDAFFPFRDAVDEAAKAGITAIIQPGGSIRDNEVIDAANEYGIAMVFTGIRLFLH